MLDGEIKSFRIYRLAISIYGDIHILSRYRVDSSRKINETERSGRMQGLRVSNLLEISINFSLFDCLRGGSA